MRRVSRTHRVALDWLFDRINLDTKIQTKYIDTKNQIAAAKSRPMMNLIARTPSVVSSSTSSSPVKRWYGNQDPWKSVVVDDRSGQPDRLSPAGYSKLDGYQDPGKSVPSDDRTGKPEKPSQPDYSQEDYGRSGSSQEWKSGTAEHDRSGKNEEISWDILPQVDPHREEPLLGRGAHSARYGELTHDRTEKPEKLNHQEEANSENFVVGSDAAEFVNKVKDQVRNRQKRMPNVAESGDEHSIIWGMFMAATMNAATFMGKNFSTVQSVVKNLENLTLKQMFDVTAQLVNNQEEINCLDKILWGKNFWTRLSSIDDGIVINLQRTKVHVFSDSVLCLGKVLQHPESNEAWKSRVAGIRFEKSYRD